MADPDGFWPQTLVANVLNNSDHVALMGNNWRVRQQSRQTHREEELFHFLHGVCHPQVRIRHRGEHLDEDVQLHGQVGVLGLAPFPQALLLESAHTHTRASQEKKTRKR